MSSRGEQTSKEIIRIHRCLEDAYENNNRSLMRFLLSVGEKRFFPPRSRTSN